MRTSDLSRLLLVGVTLANVGCGREPARPQLFPVTGRVTVGTKPAAKAVVAFHPADGSRAGVRPHAEVGDDGTFAVGTYAAGDGAPAGDYAVTVEWPETTTEKGTGDQVTVDRLKGRFRDPAKSKWKVTVKPGDNALEPFRLD